MELDEYKAKLSDDMKKLTSGLHSPTSAAFHVIIEELFKIKMQLEEGSHDNQE